jgi:dipeptidyl aminopeptidase/acylaminoacyl peptidase
MTLIALLAVAAVVQPGVISTEKNEYNLTRSADGAVQVFARSEADFQKTQVLVIERGQAPAPIAFSTPETGDSDPQVSADGQSLLFISKRPLPDRPEGKDLNIWRSRRTADGWSAPEPVAGVNSPGAELGPELHGDMLTFNSSRPGGQGKLDVWAARRAGDGFETPTPLPAPLNSPASEGDFTLSADGRVALFWSDRPGGLGEGDIWMSVRQGDGWSEPVNLGAPVNSEAFDFGPAFSADGRTLTFASLRKQDGADRLSEVYEIPVSTIPVLAKALDR